MNPEPAEPVHPRVLAIKARLRAIDCAVAEIAREFKVKKGGVDLLFMYAHDGTQIRLIGQFMSHAARRPMPGTTAAIRDGLLMKRMLVNEFVSTASVWKLTELGMAVREATVKRVKEHEERTNGGIGGI
jgi:hypothetical protein